ncbi:sensor histidine kinase [Halobium salinum]|uniref:histidine kinase n=1 Tax=Halobium salinum TaxID=1364940 RepID=A0ABD5PBF2_9EURY|nr:ATP-binding protein [Halobium salinum]
MNLDRLLVCGSVSVTGLALAATPATRLVTPGESALGLLIAGIGTLVALVVAAAGGLLYRSDVTTGNAARIAGWNLLGVVVLGSVLVLASYYVPAAAPTFLVATVLAVSAFAHVLIGFNDVRRIRAEELATKTEKLAVLNRLLRHNLRTEAQLIGGYADLVVESAGDETTRGHALTVKSHAEKLGRMNDNVKQIFWALDADAPDRETMDAELLVEGAVEEVRADHPDATFSIDASPGVAIDGGQYVRSALAHLVENAVAHNDSETPRVRVSVTVEDDVVAVAVHDNGPGIPEMERSVVAGDSEITQLNHGQGLGLWVTKWVAHAYDGAFDVEGDEDGTTATLRLRKSV